MKADLQVQLHLGVDGLVEEGKTQGLLDRQAGSAA